MASAAGSKGSSQPPSKPTDGASPAPAGPVKRIGKYEIQKKIGAGGMGAVYLALDPSLKRSCALKLLPQEKAKNPTLVRRFKAEAQAAANLRHENIVTVFEAGDADGYSYIALEYVEGTDVARLVEQRGVIPLKRSLEIVRQVAKALEHAHQQGIVHRDIKPGNLLVRRDGVVKLADLGLARMLDENTDTSITRAGTTVGTVDYMSPEQARDSKAADVRSDIYSLGCTWYYMLTGRPPFPDGSLTNKLRAHAETPLPDPRSENPAVSEAVVGVMRRMTEKKSGKRYQTPADLLADLDAAISTSDIVSDTILSELSDEEDETYEKNGAVERDESDAPATKRRKKAAPKSKRGSAVDDGATAHSGPATRPSRKSDPAVPAFKPPPGKDKPVEAKKPVRGNAALFYGLAGLLIVGIVAAIIAVVRDYGVSGESGQDDRMASPFANRKAASDAAGRAPDAAKSVSGNSNASADGADPGGAQRITIQSDEQSDAANTVGPGQSTGVEAGPGGTRITGEGGVVKTEITGAATAGSEGAASAAGTGAAGQVPGGTVSGGTASGGTAPGSWAAGGARGASVPSAARIKAETAFVPNWAKETHSTDGLARLVVQQGTSGDGQFSSLNLALEQVPGAGAVIQLVGNGPFPLYPVKVADKGRIVIEPKDPSDPRISPLVVLLPPEEGSASNFVEFSNTTLELRKIHLGLDASGLGTAPDDALLSAISSDVFLQNCSLSVKGMSKSPMTALKIAGKASAADGKSGSQTRVLIENTIIRGNRLTGVLVNTEHLDLALRGSLLWSGDAAAVRFGELPRSDADSGRNLRFASTTLCSRRCAIEMAGDASHPVPTSISLLNSLVAAPAGAAAPVLLDLESWTQNQQKAALGKFITWKTTDSLYTGWTTLIRVNPGEIAAAATPAQWSQVWKDKAAPPKNQFQPATWPARPIADITAASFDPLAPQSVGKQYVKTSDGGWPGCLGDGLVFVKLDSLDAVQAAAIRPEIPHGMFGFEPAETIRVDVTKEDLGKVLERKKLKNGTQIVAAGFGICHSSAIVIEGAWVRLAFEQTEGRPPLVLTPRGAEAKHDGFISVVNGGIEIVGAVFAPPTSERQALPKWYIQVIDGDLAMWRCRVHGPLSGTTRNKGLIQWVRHSGRPPTRLFEGSYEGYAAFSDCYLIGSGTLIEADMRRRALFFRNTIAVSRDDLLSLSVRGQDSQIGGIVDLHESTLSAVDRLVHVDGAELGSPTNSPLAFFVDRCVFAPPLRAAQQRATPTLFSYSGPVLEQKQVTWWENRCGYAADISTFLRLDSEPSTAQDFEQTWVGQWGHSQVVEPLLGVRGVVLRADLPTKTEDRAKLEPADFELHSAAKAATWDGANRPIGAKVAAMNLPPLRASGSAPAKTKPAKTTSPATPVPGF